MRKLEYALKHNPMPVFQDKKNKIKIKENVRNWTFSVKPVFKNKKLDGVKFNYSFYY